MSTSKSVAKNAAWLMVATTLNKVVAFVAFMLVARFVGPHITGTFFYSVSVTSVFVVLADLGMTPVIIRAIAAAREDGESLLGAAFRLKTILAPIAIMCALGYGALNHNDAQTMATIGIACLVMTADTCHLALYGALRGRQNLRPEAIGMFVGQLLTAAASITAALLGFGPVGLAASLLLGSLWNVVWALGRARQFGIKIRRPVLSDYRHLLVEAVPFRSPESRSRCIRMSTACSSRPITAQRPLACTPSGTR
jgi:O-antigen/teichoic acid export membrane protein